jgi:GAF domain-containing protein
LYGEYRIEGATLSDQAVWMATIRKPVGIELPQGSPCRPWQAIAEELSAETNSKRAHELAQELNHALAKQELVDNALALTHSDYASLQMLFPERGSGGELRLLAFRGFDAEAAKFWEWVRADSKSTCGVALQDKKRVVASDIARCDFMLGSDDQQVYLETGIRACQTTPLIGCDGNVIGMISTHWRTPHKSSEEDLRLFDTLARQAAEFIECCKRDGDLP